MAKDRRNVIIDRGLAIHKMIRLLTLSTGRGGYLNFMGNEFGHPEWIDFPREGNDWSFHYCRRQWHLVDDPFLSYEFLGNFDREMVELAKKFNLLTCDDPQLIKVHNDDKVMVFRRGKLLFVFNFHWEKSFSDYPIEMDEGTFVQIFNSDEKEMGGFDRTTNGQEHHCVNGKLSLYLPARMALVLETK